MFEDMTPETIKRGILERAGVELETREGGFLDSMAGPVAQEIWKLYQAMNALVPIAYVDESSGGYIDLRCGAFGIERKEGKRAAARMALTGTDGTVIPKGTAFLSAEGLVFTLTEDAVLSGGTATGNVEASETGAAYNVEAGELSQMAVTLPGLTGWNNGPASGGVDPESDAALVGRLYDRLQKPATSGNVYHYESWAKEVPGIGEAKVEPLWAGPGTVKVLVTGPDRGAAEPEAVAYAAAHIEELRPIGATVTVESAEGLFIDVKASVTLDGSATQEQVKAAFASRLDAYLKSIAFRQYTLLYNRVAFLLLDTGGVTDYTGLTVNGGTGNVAVGAGQVPVLGEVSLS